jgi:hypothetical protein
MEDLQIYSLLRPTSPTSTCYRPENLKYPAVIYLLIGHVSYTCVAIPGLSVVSRQVCDTTFSVLREHIGIELTKSRATV